MSDTPTLDELGAAADLAELTAEELLRRAKECEEQARSLLQLASGLNAVAAGLGVPDQAEVTDEQREQNRWGQDFGMSQVIAWAKENSPFTRREFQDALKMTPPQASKWLARLTNNKPHPIVTFTIQGGPGRAHIYEYNPAFGSDPTERPEHARAVEQMAGVGVDATQRTGQVAYTGRAPGRSGKPGLDRRVARRRRDK